MMAAVNGVLRIIDANANRAREALRVMEDAARFVLNDAPLTARLKQIRHDLVAALKDFDGLELHRDTPGDIGTTISTASERERRSAGDVVIAAGKRLTEALRSIEEYAKVSAPILATNIEQIRYRAYEIERRMHLRLGSGRATQWQVCVIVTEALCTHHRWQDIARLSIEAGADCIQLREKSLTDAELLARAKEVVAIASGRASVIINDRVDVAMLAGADGVHLGEHDLTVEQARELAGSRLIIGATTHDLLEAQRAVDSGADYCGVGAMFPTSVKPERTPSGLAYLKSFLARFPSMPHLAIGGVSLVNISALINAGCQGVAVSSSVCGVCDTGAVVASLCAAFGSQARTSGRPATPEACSAR